MSEEIEKLIKIQGVLNRSRYHLNIHTDLEKSYRWILFQVLDNVEDYLSSNNRPIMESSVDTIDDLIKYLEKHDGLSRRL